MKMICTLTGRTTSMHTPGHEDTDVHMKEGGLVVLLCNQLLGLSPPPSSVLLPSQHHEQPWLFGHE